MSTEKPTLRELAAIEFQGIFLDEEQDRRPMSVPKPYRAANKLIREVQDITGITDTQKAAEVADWVADKMERFGAYSARPVFTMDGEGPCCSWCGIIWLLCGHHHWAAPEGDHNEQDEFPHRDQTKENQP